MRILVYPTMMDIGGSQINAVELAAGVRALGHDVTLFGPNGALVEVARDLGLEYHVSPREHTWPSLANIRALTALVRDMRPDLIHAYEGGAAATAAFGPYLRRGTPMVTTVMSMNVPPLIPGGVPLIVGTAALVAQQSGFRSDVHLMEPPVDTERNAPTVEMRAQGRELFGVNCHDQVVSVVGRLVPDLEKLNGVLQAIRVVDSLAEEMPVRLLIVGDGEGIADVRSLALQINKRHAYDVIIVKGPMLDPRMAYAAADVVIGMGGSALKGMAFAKPLIVQGAAGFWQVADHDSLDVFLDQGWYGVGGRGAEDLKQSLKQLLSDPLLRDSLGGFGRSVVLGRYSLTSASVSLAQIYEEAVGGSPSPGAIMHSLLRLSLDLAKSKLHRAREQWLGASPDTPIPRGDACGGVGDRAGASGD